MKRGTVVSERYTIQGLAGTGGMGSVYRAIDLDGQPVALKVLTGGRQRMDMRFIREARILMRLRHPHIVRCLDSGVTHDGQRFLVMEWLDGIDVESCLRTETLTLEQALLMAEAVASGLGFAHAQGMVHRDVKPSNVFLSKGEVAKAKLLDFGVAHWSDATSLTATGMQIGTPSYMAPEQIRGESTLGPTADVFSLGCVLFKCLTGQTAFAGANRVAVFYKILLNEIPRISEYVTDAPPSVLQLLERMMAKDPAERHRNGNEVAEHIAGIRAELADSSGVRLQPASAPHSALTSSERKLVSVVVVAREHSETDALTDVNLSRRAVTMLLEDQSDSDETLAELRALRARHESLGVSFDSLANGSLIAVLDDQGAATDQAAAAARCALDLSATLSGQPVAVATGRAELGQAFHRLDEVIERAVSMLTTEHRDKVQAPLPQTGAIYLDDTTAGLVAGRFSIEGSSGAQLLIRESEHTEQPVLLGQHSPFVGRKREMRTLTAILDECIDDEVARAVLITGPPGIGKSRLQREFMQHVDERDDGTEIWTGRGDPMRTGSPLEVIAQAIRASANIREDEPLDVRRDKLRARVAISVPETHVERVSAFVGKLIKTPWAYDTDVQLQAARADARLMGDRVRQSCEELLAADLRKHPVILIIDDFQWCSRATAGWIDRILRNLAETPLLVLAFARPEVHDAFPKLWSSHDLDEIHLRALTKKAAQKLVRSVLGDQVDDDLASDLIERANGNALYLEGLMRSAKAGRQDLPDSMLAMVHSRLNELQPSLRRALRAASVFGKRFWPGGLEALLGEDTKVTDFLHGLLIAELIQKAQNSEFAEEDEYGFRHDVIREAAYSMLTEEDRTTGHRLAGGWLESRSEADDLVVAVHYERGGALDKALHFFQRAAEHACHNGDFPAAISLAERGVACGAKGEALGALRAVQAKACYWDGQLKQAGHEGQHAVDLLVRGSRAWYEAIDFTTLARFLQGQAYEVERYARWLAPPRTTQRDEYEDYDEWLPVPEDDEDSGESEEPWIAPPPPEDHDRSGWLRLAADLANHLFRDGRVDMARALLARVELEIGDLDEADPWVAALVHSARATRATLTQGNPAATLRETLRAMACYQEAGDRRRACLETVNIARAQIELGLFDSAATNLRSSLATAAKLAVDFLIDLAQLYTSVALAHNGAPDKALTLAESCAEGFERRGNRRLAATTYIHLALFYRQLGDMRAAESTANLAVESSSRTSPVHAHALAGRASVLLACDRAAEALNATVQALTLMQDFGSVDEGEALIRLVYAESLHATGQHDAARIAITQARNRLQRRATLIDRPDWHRSFLRNVPENARTLELASEWIQRAD